jgi:hypothetical protein
MKFVALTVFSLILAGASFDHFAPSQEQEVAWWGCWYCGYSK